MDDLDDYFKIRYKEALKHAIHGRTERTLTICWEFRLEPRLKGTYRRCMLDTLFALVLEPYGQMCIIEDTLEQISDLQKRTRLELTPGLEILRPILQDLGSSWRTRQGYMVERTKVENDEYAQRAVANFEAVHNLQSEREDRLRQYRKETKKMFRLLAESSFKEDKSVGWEDEASTPRDDLVALEMKHLHWEDLIHSDVTRELYNERERGHLRDDEERELAIRETLLEAWLAGMEERKREMRKREIFAMEQKGFSKEDQFRGILEAMRFERAEAIFHDEFRMPLLRALPDMFVEEG